MNSEPVAADSAFDVETRARPTAVASTFEADLTASWNIGENPNGGYAASCLLSAFRQVSPHGLLLSMTTHFVRPALGDSPAEIEVDVVRVGRTTATLSGTLRQGGKERLRAIATFGPPPADDLAPLLSIAPPKLPTPEDCRTRDSLEQGVDLPILSRLEVRLDPELAEPGVAGRAETAGWIRFADGRPPDSSALLLFCDAFPPSPFGLLGRVGWVPTLELTVHLRREPAPGWIRARFQTRDLLDGFLIEDGVLWDSQGQVVAQCRQLAMLLQTAST